MERIAKRLLIIGWDAADWKIIDALFARNLMPNLRKMVDGGVRANLASLEPRLSPLLWTSIATGKTADKHGILNFVEPDPGGSGLRISSSTTRKTKALWNMLTQSGMRVNVVNWYASHPAEPISGVCVSNLFQENIPAKPPAERSDAWPLPKGAVHPPEWAERIAAKRVHTAAIPASELQTLLPKLKEIPRSDHRVQMLAKHLAQCVSVQNAVSEIIAGDKTWDCTMVFFDTIDSVGHNFMQYYPPRMAHVSQRDFDWYGQVMSGVYRLHDKMVASLLALAGSDTTIILLSDHGFYSDHRRPVIKDMSQQERAMVEASWHRPFGVLAMGGPGIRRGQQIYGATLLDITPTALALLGLHIGADMSGRPLSEAFDRPMTPEKLLSWDMLKGEAGMHPPDLRQDPFEAQDALQQLVDLGYMPELPQDAQAKFDMAWRETRANLGTIYTTSGQAALAVPVFEELATKYPNERRYAFGLARALYVAAQHARCAAVLREYLSQNPGSIEAMLMLGLSLVADDRPAEALEVLPQLEQSYGGRSEFEASMGDICVQLQRWDDADRHYRAALRRDPEAALVHLGLARAAIGRERFEEAVDHALRAVELVHVFPDAHHALGVALTWMQDYEHAIKAFEIALSMRPGMLDSHRYLATIYRQRGDSANAAKHREIAQRLISESKSGQTSIEFLKREAPMGPQEWARRMGMQGEE